MLCSTHRLFSAILCTFLAIYAHATPVALEERTILEAYQASKRDVVAPPITKPDATTVWPVGTVQEVTWDTSKLPPDNQITNPIGRVLLGRDTGDSLNLDLDNPLAQGFHIRQGRVSITVPNVIPRPDYLIVLMGNSGNTSPSFAITQISGGGNSTTSPVPPVINPTPSLPGIVPTRSTRPAPPISAPETSISPTSLITTPISESVPTSVALPSDVTSGSSSTRGLGSSASRSTGASPSAPSDLNQEDEGSALSRQSFSIVALMGASFCGFLISF